MNSGQSAEAISLARRGIALIEERRKQRGLSSLEEIRFAALSYKLGQLLGMHDQPNEMRPCEAIPHLQNTLVPYEQRYRLTPKAINALVLLGSALNGLASAQALCGHKEAIATAQRAVDLYGVERANSNPNLELTLGLAHLYVGDPAQAKRHLQNASAQSSIATEYLAEIAFRQGDLGQARQLLAAARQEREKTLKQPSFSQRIDAYRQAANLARAVGYGDPAPGLKQQAIEYLKDFPLHGAAASVDKLRVQLQSLK
jgi:hypothetical protein